MTTEVARPNPLQRFIAFLQEVRAELNKVTWPDWPQVRQLSLLVILLSLVIGGVIAIIDVVFQGIFVRGIPSLLGG